MGGEEYMVSRSIPNARCRLFVSISRNLYFKPITDTLLTTSVSHSRFSLTVMVPTACALFPQQSSIKLSTLEKYEPERYAEIVKKCEDKLPDVVYCNKGL